MENPGEMIRRARRREKLPSREAPATGPAREEAPMPAPVSRHGTYTALMRSHDRVHTRHVQERR